jgi:hypothetical protein
MRWKIKNADDCYTDESHNVFDTFREAQEAADELLDIYPDGDFIVVAITKDTA